MVVSAVQSSSAFGPHHRLSQSRVFVSGAEGAAALGLVSLLGETGCRLVLDSASQPFDTLALAPAATVLDGVAATDSTAVRIAQAAVMVDGGIDLALNIIRPAFAGERDDADAFEAASTEALRGAFHVTRVIANRMRTTWNGGTIVNVFIEPAGLGPRGRVLSQMTRATLAGWTRVEAARWADDDVKILAIAPVIEEDDTDCVSCLPGLAELVLSIGNGSLGACSGVTLDPAQAGNWC